MSDIILMPNQYKDLESCLGERNKVSMVVGKEYKIDTSNVFTISEGSKTISVGSKTYVSSWAGLDASNIFGTHWRVREEYCTISGSYSFAYTPTGESFDINSVVASYELRYNKYHKSSNPVNGDNWTSSKCVFSSIKSSSNLEKGDYSNSDWDSNNECWKTSGMIEHSRGKISNWLGQEAYTDSLYYPSQYVNVRFSHRVYNSSTQLTTYYFNVSYCFVSATGWSKFHNGFWSDSNNSYYREVQQAIITIKACSVTSEEINKSVGDGTQKITLQTNELMQSSMSSSTSLFDTTASQIIDAYSNNRLIVTLKLLEIKKYTINGESRMLRAGDKVKIKNNKDKFISEYTKLQNSETIIDGNEFEIIKLANCYEGRFYKQLTLREVLREDQ